MVRLSGAGRSATLTILWDAAGPGLLYAFGAVAVLLLICAFAIEAVALRLVR